MPISDKVKRLLDKFSAATIRAAMADRPEIMQASGWNYDKDGNLVQGDFNEEGATRLREGLAAASLAANAGMGIASVPSGAAASAGKGAAHAIEWAGEKAMPSSFFNGLGYYMPDAAGYLSQIGKIGDVAALSYWSAKAADEARKAHEEGDDVKASALAATAALPVVMPAASKVSKAVKSNGRSLSDKFKLTAEEVANFSDDIARTEKLDASKKDLADKVSKMSDEELYKFWSDLPTMQEYDSQTYPDYYKDIVSRELDSRFKPAEALTADELGYDAIPAYGVKDLSEVDRNRQWLKDVNRKFVRRYHYDPIDLSLSEDTDAAEAAVKNLLSRHNRVVRGSSDFMSSHNNLKPYEKDFAKSMMREVGLNPENKEDRLMYTSLYYAPNSSYGRSGVSSGTLARVLPDGSLYNPADILYQAPQGTHYASNSIGTAEGYTYHNGKIALLEYPYSLGPDRNRWIYEADAPISEPGSSGGVRRFLAKQYQSYLGEKPNIPVPDMQYEQYGMPVSKMTVNDLDNHVASNRTEWLLGKIHDYLAGTADIAGQHVYQPFILPKRRLLPDFDGGWSPESYDFGSNFLKEKLGYIDNPTTVGDAVNNFAIYDALEITSPKVWYNKGAVRELGSIVRKRKDAYYKQLKGPLNSVPFKYEMSKNTKQYYNDLFKKYQKDPDFQEFIDRIPKERIKDATQRNTKKSDSAFTHLISVGEIGTPAANFVEWIDPKEYSLEQIGAVTRQHYGTGADFLTRNTRASGGKIHIKPENRGKFTALKERTGHSASWFKEHGTPAQKKMAVFALNSRKWKHGDGGFLENDYNQGYIFPAPSIQTVPEAVAAPAPVKSAIDYDELKRRQYYIESKFNDKAKSGAGAQGAYQIMPITYKDYVQRTGKTGDLNDYAYNESIRDYYMDRHLNSAWATKNDQSEYNRVAKALAAYNWGSGNLLKYLDKQKAAGKDIYGGTDWIAGLPGETKNYIKWILDGEDIGNRTTNAAYEKAKKRRFDFGGYVKDLIDQSGGDLTTLKAALKAVKAG